MIRDIDEAVRGIDGHGDRFLTRGDREAVRRQGAGRFIDRVHGDIVGPGVRDIGIEPVGIDRDRGRRGAVRTERGTGHGRQPAGRRIDRKCRQIVRALIGDPRILSGLYAVDDHVGDGEFGDRSAAVVDRAGLSFNRVGRLRIHGDRIRRAVLDAGREDECAIPRDRQGGTITVFQDEARTRGRQARDSAADAVLGVTGTDKYCAKHHQQQ